MCVCGACAACARARATIVVYWVCNIQLTPCSSDSMPYYTYGSTANFLFLEPTALNIYIYIYIKRTAL